VDGIARHIAILTFVRWASVAAGFATSILIARVLSSAEIGAAAVALTLATIVALLANGGLNIAAIYYLGQRPHQRQQITHTSILLGVIACTVAAALVLLAGPIVMGYVERGEILLILAATAVASGIIAFELSGSLLLGLGRHRVYLIAQVIEGIGSLCIAAAILLFWASAPGYVASVAIAYWGAALPSTLAACRAVGWRRLRWDAAYARDAMSMGWRGQIGNIFQFLNLRFDHVLVAMLAGLSAAGVYLIASRVAEAIIQVASASGTLLFPHVARGRSQDTSLTERTVRLTLVVVLILAAGVFVAASPVLTIAFGAEFERGATALRILVLAMLPLTLVRLLAGDLKGRGRAGLVSLGTALGLIASVSLNLLLIPTYGVEGAALASLAAYAAAAAVLVFAYRAVTNRDPRCLVPRLSDATALVIQAGLLLQRHAAPRRANPSDRG
jgi:O-antigen/teichoic acid export membrane protein